jgi:predicted ATPase/transcriptional regulator with XRE-family HTH domain
MEATATSLEFGQLLRRFRLAAQLTQEQLAERSGLSVRAIQAAERGRTRPQRESVARLARAMKLTPGEQAQFGAAAPSAPRDRPAYASTVTYLAVAVDPLVSPALWGAGVPATQPHALRRSDPRDLPESITSFVGRERELAELSRLLATNRLVTLTGAGGVGKTRLALEVIRTHRTEFADGVVFAPLAALSDPGFVNSAIAQAFGVQEVAGQPIAPILHQVLKDWSVLLVLDSFEHVIAAASDVAELLAACARLRVLVTSREVLRISGEHEFGVPPLGVPRPSEEGAGDQIRQSEAVRLFVERARAVKPDFELTDENGAAIAEICRQLDGLPLAIELAAARIRLFSPRALLGRLEPRLSLLTGGPRDLPLRQRALRDTVAWSYDLLAPGEQALFRRLGVFVGGCTLESAAKVIGEADGPGAPDIIAGLDSLVSKSLLRQGEDLVGESRFSMLETIREFAVEQLALAGEADRFSGEHARYFLALAEEADRNRHKLESTFWLDRLELELRNLAAALAWFRSEAGLAGDGAIAGLTLAVAVGKDCVSTGTYLEGQQWLEEAIRAAEGKPEAVQSAAWAKALMLAGWLAWGSGDIEAGTARINQSVDLLRALDEPTWLARALNWRGYAALGRGELDRAAADIEEALALNQVHDTPRGTASSWSNLGEVARAAGDDERAAFCYEESVRWSRAAGEESHCAIALSNLGFIRAHQGDASRASELFRESVEVNRRHRNFWAMGYPLAGLGGVAARAGQPDRAARLLGAAETWFRRLHTIMQPPDRADFERDRAMVRSRLDEAAFAAAWAEGAAMTREQAVDYALGSG